MKKYTKPEITVTLFETNDVISTSCTCLEGKDRWYYVETNNIFTVLRNQDNTQQRQIFAPQKIECDEHGTVYFID